MTPSSAEDTRRIARLVVDLLHTTSAARRDEPMTAAGAMPADPGARRISAHGMGDGRSAVSPQAIRAAVFVYEMEEATVGGIATSLGISAGWASRLVEELEERGYVVRERDHADRRVVRIRLSPDAVEEVSRVYRWRDEAVERALAGLDADGLAAVSRFLAALVEELTPEPGQR
jgi:DNA-binding MarR family transcriptional regulator